MTTVDPRVRGARAASAIYAVVHLAVLLWIWSGSDGLGPDDSGFVKFAAVVCLIPLPTALLLWRTPPRESVMVTNIIIVTLYGIAMFVYGGLAVLFTSGRDQGSGFGGHGIAPIFPWLGYLLLTLYVIWKNVAAMKAV